MITLLYSDISYSIVSRLTHVFHNGQTRDYDYFAIWLFTLKSSPWIFFMFDDDLWVFLTDQECTICLAGSGEIHTRDSSRHEGDRDRQFERTHSRLTCIVCQVGQCRARCHLLLRFRRACGRSNSLLQGSASYPSLNQDFKRIVVWPKTKLRKTGFISFCHFSQ